MFPILIVLFCFFCENGFAETPFSVEIHTSANEITLEETVEVMVTVNTPNTHTIDWQIIRQFFEQAPAWTLIAEQQQQPLQATYTLEPWKTETLRLSVGAVTFQPLDPSTHQPITVLSNIATINVKPIEQPTELSFQPQLLPLEQQPLIVINKANEQWQKEDAQQKRETNRNFSQFHSRTFPWIWVILFTIMLLTYWKGKAALHRLFIFQQQPQKEQTPQEIAFDALHQLLKEQYPEKGKFDPFYVGLTDIVRHYIEGHYSIDAPEQTTEEFLQLVTTHPQFDPPTRQRLEDFLFEADLVKFARQQSTTENCLRAHKAATQFVEGETSP